MQLSKSLLPSAEGETTHFVRRTHVVRRGGGIDGCQIGQGSKPNRCLAIRPRECPDNSLNPNERCLPCCHKRLARRLRGSMVSSARGNSHADAAPAAAVPCQLSGPALQNSHFALPPSLKRMQRLPHRSFRDVPGCSSAHQPAHDYPLRNDRQDEPSGKEGGKHPTGPSGSDDT